MPELTTVPEPTTHPSPSDLHAYGLGQLPPDEATAIESHISECEPCCETIADLSSDDTFVGLLKEARRLPVDQTLDHDSQGSQPSSSHGDIPPELAEHPRYEIVRLIGKGGMGDVYEAIHRKMERGVALKVINRELFQKAEAVNRFHREVKTAAQLSHPNIVTAFDADQAGDFHFMVMEYVDGVDLSHVVKDRGALPIAEACDYVRQAAIGLQHAHERGMVHRDIKPHNLMVTVDGTIKILDFGLASIAPEAVPASDAIASRSDLTAAGAIMGTPDFISPEQAEDARQVDIRSDIYSLGATFYYLLSGQAPFDDGSVMHKLKSHAQVEPAPLDSMRDDVPEELVSIVSSMLAKDPDERFQSPAELAATLEKFAMAGDSSSAAAQAEDLPQRDARLADDNVVMSGNAGDDSGNVLTTGDDQGGDNRGLRAWLWLGWGLIAMAFVCVGLNIASMKTVYDVLFPGGTASEVAAGVSGSLWYTIVGLPALLAGMIVLVVTYLRRAVRTSGRQTLQPTKHHTRATRKRSRFLPLTAVASLFVAAIVAGVIYYLQTNLGVVRVEVTDPSLQVSIHDQTITMKDGDGKPLTIRPGEQTLIVRMDDADFEFETNSFQIRRGDKIAFTVEMVLGEIVVRKDGDPFDRAHLLVGEWRGKHNANEEVRLTLNANGTFEMIHVDPAKPQQPNNRTVGRYKVDSSVSPAHLDLDGTIIYTAFDPETAPPIEYEGSAPEAVGPERETVKKHKFEAIIELIDANTLHISDLEDDARPEAFGEESMVLHRQGVPIARKGELQQRQKVNQRKNAVTAAEPRDREPEEELKQLQGDWDVIAFTQDGKKEFAADKGVGMLVQIKGETITMIQTAPNGEKSEKERGRIEINSKTNPKSIDIVNPDNPGDRLLGIYELKDGVLKICFVEQSNFDADRGRIVKRPTKFDAPAGSELVLLECRRAVEGPDLK